MITHVDLYHVHVSLMETMSVVGLKLIVI